MTCIELVPLAAALFLVMAFSTWLGHLVGVPPWLLALPLALLGLRGLLGASWWAVAAGFAAGAGMALVAPGALPGAVLVGVAVLWVVAAGGRKPETPPSDGEGAQSPMVISVDDLRHEFTFGDPRGAGVSRVAGFLYDMAQRVGQNVYLLVFHVNGAQLADPRGPVLLGRDDAAARRFEYGFDAVLWKPESREWVCELVVAHWPETYLWWGLLTDRRDTAEVVQSIAGLWPRGWGNSDLRTLIHSVSPERALAMLGCEGGAVDGRVVPEHWGAARELLAAIAGDALEVAEE